MKNNIALHFGWVFVVSLLLVLLLSACNSTGISQPTPTPIPTATPRATATSRPTATPKSASNAALLKAAATNMKNAKSYTLDADIDQAGQNVKLNGMIDIANNATKMDIEASGQQISLITVGNDVYVSIYGGTTYLNAGDSGASITQGFAGFTKMWDTFQPDQIDKAKNALKDGNPAIEKIDGVDCKHITANAKDLSILGGATGGTATEGTLDLWISIDKAYIRQMKIDGTSNGQPITGTLKWGKFDEKFDIKAPATSSRLNPLASASR